MTSLKHTKGNLLDLAEAGEFDVIIHGANCFNTMGSGIAREIRERYPNVAYVDQQTQKGDYTKLGTWTWDLAGPNNFKILNCYTQYNMSTGEDVFEYLAFALICQKLVHECGDKRIGLPYIGQGLAGGNSQIIMRMIEDFAQCVAEKNGSVTLVEFKP
jgi:O-acetyl-ADP-ribose deacetylase (regulator of RNase III)